MLSSSCCPMTPHTGVRTPSRPMRRLSIRSPWATSSSACRCTRSRARSAALSRIRPRRWSRRATSWRSASVRGTRRRSVRDGSAPLDPVKERRAKDRFEDAYSAGVRPGSAVVLQALAGGAGPGGRHAGRALGARRVRADSVGAARARLGRDRGRPDHQGRRAKPEGVLSLETDGVILPGLIDLHGHPDWNILPRGSRRTSICESIRMAKRRKVRTGMWSRRRIRKLSRRAAVVAT